MTQISQYFLPIFSHWPLLHCWGEHLVFKLTLISRGNVRQNSTLFVVAKFQQGDSAAFPAHVPLAVAEAALTSQNAVYVPSSSCFHKHENSKTCVGQACINLTLFNMLNNLPEKKTPPRWILSLVLLQLYRWSTIDLALGINVAAESGSDSRQVTLVPRLRVASHVHDSIRAHDRPSAFPLNSITSGRLVVSLLCIRLRCCALESRLRRHVVYPCTSLFLTFIEHVRTVRLHIVVTNGGFRTRAWK